MIGNPLHPVGYTTVLDYDIDDADWVDVTPIGSDVHIEVDAHSGVYRHRDFARMQPWAEGLPVKGA